MPVPSTVKTKVSLPQKRPALLARLTKHIGYGNRVRMQAMQMSDWTEQQIREKRLVKEHEEHRDKLIHEQNKHLNDLLT